MASQSKATTPADDTRIDADSAALGRQIETIRKDISALTELIADMGARRKDAATQAALEKVTQLRDRAESAGHEAQERFEALGARAEAQMRDQPARTLMLATGAGFLAGLLLARR